MMLLQFPVGRTRLRPSGLRVAGSAFGHLCADLERGLHESIDVPDFRTMVDDRRSNGDLPRQSGHGRCGNPGFVEGGDDLGIHAIRVVAPITEADDVELRRCEQLKFGFASDLALEILCEAACLRDDGANLFRAVHLQREPRLQGPKAA